MLQCGIALLWAVMLQVAGASLTDHLLPGVKPRVFSQMFSLPDRLAGPSGPAFFWRRSLMPEKIHPILELGRSRFRSWGLASLTPTVE